MFKPAISLTTVISLLLSSCSMSSIVQTQKAIKQDKQTGNSLYKQMHKPVAKANISFSNKPFLAAKVFTVADNNKQSLPAIFDQKVSIHTNSLKAFDNYITDLRALTGIDIQISSDALDKLNSTNDTKKDVTTVNTNDLLKLSMNYSGSLKGYLDQLTNRFGLFWDYDFTNNHINVFYTQTQTFKLVVPESEIENHTSISNSDANNKSNVSYKTKTFDAFGDAIQTIKSFAKDIQISANNSYAMITVTATPTVIAKVAKYIDKFNKEAKQGVQIKIAVYEVKTTKATNYGIDWNLVYNGTHGKINWDTVGISDVIGNSNITTATVKAGMNAGMWAGSNIVASALQKYLDATYVQGFSFYSLNGQSTPLNNGKSTAYVKNLAVTTLGAGAVITADNIQTAVEQATINTGFTGSVLTNVIDNKIFLRMSLDMSKLTKLEKLDYGNKDHPSVIQLPHTENNKIIQNVILKSGQTAVITGFSNDANKLGTASIGDKKWWYLGGNQATDAARETLVVIVSAYNIGDNDD
ncbi:hypothetical protein [Francisella sp. TX07-6608]|uniref:hypothetical protein n=1 Tax=Francisella sp. TX07-6608 TaxID=573568 RepID=UPI0008F9D5E1|nr:hypothetical protein [Francisella sp. TX07-6608]OIN82967.1 bacterial type II and III secretion system family protein [Francisella sp. TX07-6608]